MAGIVRPHVLCMAGIISVSRTQAALARLLSRSCCVTYQTNFSFVKRETCSNMSAAELAKKAAACAAVDNHVTVGILI